jgi:methenyltetrahydrofolate cyclohydrolase
MPSLRSLTLGDFLDQIGAKTPAPGGGAVASATGAIASALGRMVVAYSVGKKSLAEHQPTLERAAQVLSRTSELLLELAEEDAAAYTAVNELSKLPETDERRLREWSAAAARAVDVPRAIVGACCDLLRLLESLQPITNTHLRSDLAIAAILAEAGAKSGWWNVKVNLDYVTDPTSRIRLESEMQTLLTEASKRRHHTESACA